jgi:prophage antirepressor-like protein
MNLIPFQFENASVRVVLGENGEPLFVGKDVCDALGYTNHNKAMNDHCRGVTTRYPLQTAGGMQNLRVLTEPDVFRLVMKSELPSAERFEQWVFEEVLPTIRKTGAYAVGDAAPVTQQHLHLPSPETLAADCIQAKMRVAALFDVPLHLAQTAAVKDARLTYNVDHTDLLLAAPAQDNIKDEDVMLEPTPLGEIFGMGAKAMNIWLRDMGLQTKLGRGWEPTSAGAPLCIKHHWVTKETSGYNLKWRVEAIKNLMTETV